MPPKKGSRTTAEPAPSTGRPTRRATSATSSKQAAAEKSTATSKTSPQKRGRAATSADERETAERAPKRGRQAARSSASKAAAKSNSAKQNSAAKTAPPPPLFDETEELPRKRGASPHGGETIKVVADADAAAEQLEGELMDSAKKSARKVVSKASGKQNEEKNNNNSKKKNDTSTATEGKSKGKTTKSSAEVKQVVHETTAEKTGVDDGTKGGKKKGSAPVAGVSTTSASKQERQFWLMKAEQEDRFETAKNGQINNTKFTIDDLRDKTVPEPWDGVRNPVAAKHMRAMNPGDLAFFYASGGKAGRKPGITGIMEVVSSAEPDPSVHDAGSYGYVEKASDRDKWCIVKVEFRSKLAEPVSLKTLQTHSQTKAGAALASMQLFKQTRLSVSKVEPAEWDLIVSELVAEQDREHVKQFLSKN